MKILLGEISSYKAIVIARFIKTNYDDITVYTYDLNDRIKRIRTKYSDVHFNIDREQLEQQLEELIKKEEIDFFFPVINSNLTRFIQHKERYHNSLRYLGDFESYSILNHKDTLSELALSLGLSIPQKFNSLSEAVIPFVVKPSNLSSAEGVHYVFDEEAKSAITIDEHSIIQEYVEGIGVGYSFYAKDGEIIDGYGHKRLAEYPVTGGSSTYRTRYENQEMAQIAKTIIAYLGYTGFAMFEFKLTKENRLYLIEVNPRIWGSIHQGIADGGVNYFKAILGEGKNKFVQRQRPKNTYVGPLIYMSLLGYMMRLNFRPFLKYWSNLGNNKADVSIFTDPRGYLSMIIRKLS